MALVARRDQNQLIRAGAVPTVFNTLYNIHKKAYEYAKNNPYVQHFKKLHMKKHVGKTTVRGRSDADDPKGKRPASPPKTPRKKQKVNTAQSKVDSGSKQMGKTTKYQKYSNRRRRGPSKRSGKKYGKQTKSRRGGKKVVAKATMEMPGPIGRIHCYLPTEGETEFDYGVYDVNSEGMKASGYVNCSQSLANWIGYSILTKKHVKKISKAGELATEQTYAASAYKGIFDPAPLGVETALGNASGTAKNYVKDHETFIFDKCNLEIFLSNCNKTPVRVWVDVWKCKEDVQASEGSSFTFAGPMYDIQTSYNEQPYYQGDGAHGQKSLKELFRIPEFRPLKVPGRTHWSHQKRYTQYMVPGDETKIIHKLAGIKYNGQEVEAREAIQTPVVEYTYIKGVSHYITVCVLGLVGKSGDTGNPSGYSQAEVSTQVKMDIVAHRANIFMRQPRQYIVDTPMPLKTVTLAPKVIEITRTEYP